MNASQSRYWFRAKRYGYGWGLPISWQGWVVMVLWLVVVATAGSWIAARSIPLYCLFMVFMAAAIIGICYLKGEPARWR